MHYHSRVSTFGDLRVNGYLLLTAAYRSLSRPSSAPSAKASALCSSSLDHFSHLISVNQDFIFSLFVNTLVKMLLVFSVEIVIFPCLSFEKDLLSLKFSISFRCNL